MGGNVHKTGQSTRDRPVWEMGCVIFSPVSCSAVAVWAWKRGNCLSRLPRRTFYQGNKIRLCVAGIHFGSPPPTRISLHLRLSPHSSSAMGNKSKVYPKLALSAESSKAVQLRRKKGWLNYETDRKVIMPSFYDYLIPQITAKIPKDATSYQQTVFSLLFCTFWLVYLRK